MISTRLHVPMVSLQYGVPTISVFCESKTRVLFQLMGLERMLYSHSRMGEFTSLIMSRSKLDAFRRDYLFPDCEAAGKNSAGHLRILREPLRGVV